MFDPPAGLASSSRTVGLIQIDDALLALDVAVLREVIRCPPTLLRLPSRCTGIIGAVTLRGTIIPVLDLSQALGLPARSGLDGIIIVLRLEGRVLGLLADAICGMTQVQQSDLQNLSSSQPSHGPQLSQYGFEVGDRIAALLDGAAICRLPDVPMVEESSRVTSDRNADDARPYLLFDFAGIGFGIDAIHVEATVPRAAIQRGSLSVGSCFGMISYLGNDIPIVDTHGMLGLGPKPSPVACEAVVVRFPAGGTLAFAIDAVRDIPRLAPDAITLLPPVARGAVGLLKGMTTTADGRCCLLIDEDALRADPHMAALSRLCRPQASAKSEHGADVRKADHRNVTPDPRPYLVYTAGEVQTTPLIEVNEILPYPTLVTPLERRSDGLVGLFHHRGVVVPLIHLAQHLGFDRTILPNEARVLLMEEKGQYLGFIIDTLHSVEPAHWRTAAFEAGSSATCARAMTLVGVKAVARLVWHQDLRAIMQEIIGAAARTPSRAAAEPETLAAVA